MIEQDELFARLVDDARRREPSPEALEKLLAVLDSPAAAAPSPARAPWRLRMPSPWVCIALLGTGALIGYSTLQRPREQAGPAVATAPANAAPVDRALPSPAPDAVPSLSISELPDVEDAPARTRSVAGRSSTAPSVTSGTPTASVTKPSTARELELITRAREALTRGDARRCLATIAVHDTEFPNGQFTPEAAVMRIEATHASGDRAEARSLARSFLSKYPDSPYTARIRSLIASMEQE